MFECLSIIIVYFVLLNININVFILSLKKNVPTMVVGASYNVKIETVQDDPGAPHHHAIFIHPPLHPPIR